MSTYNPAIVRIDTLADAKQEIENIGCDPQSIDIMAPKAILRIIKCQQVMMQDAIIIKQDMLSLGGEVAIPQEAFKLKNECADILIIGTVKQLHELVEKLNRHYSRIQTLSKEISSIINTIE